MTSDISTKDVRRQKIFRNIDGARVEVRIHDDLLRVHRAAARAFSAIYAHLKAMTEMFFEADRSVTDIRVDEGVVRAFNVYVRERAKSRPLLSQLPSLKRFRDDGFDEIDRVRLERQIKSHPYFQS